MEPPRCDVCVNRSASSPLKLNEGNSSILKSHNQDMEASCAHDVMVLVL